MAPIFLKAKVRFISSNFDNKFPKTFVFLETSKIKIKLVLFGNLNLKRDLREKSNQKNFL